MKIDSRHQELTAVATFVAILAFSGTDRVFGCSCAFPTALPVEAAERANFVFTGRAASVRTVEFDLEVRIEVKDVYKGDLGPEVLVVTDASGAGCGYPFRAGVDYLVYGGGTAERIFTSHCGRTAPLAAAGGDLLALKAAAAPLPAADQLYVTAEGSVYRMSPDGSRLIRVIESREPAR
ncbi:MAG: hypothetical protein GWO24_20110 [Akkermansiaceae bacterium]|nr:hypothetical protein [Akkermansiaceae bacterium]